MGLLVARMSIMGEMNMLIPSLIVEEDGPVRIVRLNRPDALNAFDVELHPRFGAFGTEPESDDNVRAVVLTGNGRAFSAGGNLDGWPRWHAKRCRTPSCC